jgi:hypothetical protein
MRLEMTQSKGKGRLIGYARVSTKDQATDPQVDALKAAGCVEIFREDMSGAKASRPELAKVLARMRPGDVLVVARLDRLARSLSHLLTVITELDAKGAGFKSLADSIDTTTPQGRLALQALGAVAKLPDARSQAYLERVNRTAEHWLPIVKDMRPGHRWEDVVRVFNAKRERAGGLHLPWTAEKLQRAVERLVAEGLADPALLQPAGRKVSSKRLVTLVAGIRRANPEMSLSEIGAQLEAINERTPRGGTRWSPSSVKSLLDRAKKLGVLGAETV